MPQKPDDLLVGTDQGLTRDNLTNQGPRPSTDCDSLG